MASSIVTPSMGRDKGPVLLREDISDLQLAYDADDDTLDDRGKKRKIAMQKLLWAFHCIQNLDTRDWNSYFLIAGFHGMPFRGAGWGSPSWWGGYCNHGNVLFPTWHRAYLVRLENALRAVTGYDDIALPYWDETGKLALMYGIPSIFLRPTVDIPYSVAKQRGKGKITIDNPLRSYRFQDGVWDNLNPIPDADYSKPQGYVTKRYPFSGLVSSDDAGATKQHNKFVAMLDTDDLLNKNVVAWLANSITNSDGNVIETNAAKKYQDCLKAPNYTVFSNTTSATQYNEDVYYNTPGNGVSPQAVPPKKPGLPVVSLESPHNDIHLAIGGFDIPGQGNFDSIIGANGDMGENDTAAFDPIFYFHHCFVDKVFWDWQRKWDPTLHSRTQLTIETGYPGTNSVDYQGPTPGVAGNTWLKMESPLAPFTIDDTKNGKALTSNDVVDIVGQLRYKYYGDDEGGSGGGLSGEISQPPAPPRRGHRQDEEFPPPHPHLSTGDRESLPVQVVRVSGVNRATLAGSFVLVVRAVVNGEDRVVGTESVLSRWKVSGCANCQEHLGVKAFVPLVGLDVKALSTIRVGLHARGKRVDDLNNDRSTGGSWRIGNMEMPHETNIPTRSGEASGSGGFSGYAQ
ncbi:hypothetical protein DL770_010596 [Monosporascus sp. CRB-9-2]|nr:hypothetical protein DL770_010596 [Monosporascus sp. CRB-9-2]